MATVSIRFYRPDKIELYEQLERSGKLGPRQGRVLQAWRILKADYPQMVEMTWDGHTATPIRFRRELRLKDS